MRKIITTYINYIRDIILMIGFYKYIFKLIDLKLGNKFINDVWGKYFENNMISPTNYKKLDLPLKFALFCFFTIEIITFELLLYFYICDTQNSQELFFFSDYLLINIFIGIHLWAVRLIYVLFLFQWIYRKNYKIEDRMNGLKLGAGFVWFLVFYIYSAIKFVYILPILIYLSVYLALNFYYSKRVRVLYPITKIASTYVNNNETNN